MKSELCAEEQPRTAHPRLRLQESGWRFLEASASLSTTLEQMQWVPFNKEHLQAWTISCSMSLRGETLPRLLLIVLFVSLHFYVHPQGFVLYFPIIVAFSYHRGLAFLGTFVLSEWANMVFISYSRDFCDDNIISHSSQSTLLLSIVALFNASLLPIRNFST